MKTGTGFFFCMLLLVVAACNNQQKKMPEVMIAKTVPLHYMNAADTGFANHQDTVYYKGSFFTGFQYALFPSGDTEFVKSYFNGVEEGTQKKWYSNRQLAEQRFYINGKKEGLQQGWWQDGKQKFVFEASHDAFVGEAKEWNAAGMLYRDFHYVNGQEEGSQKMWWDNGSIRANYVIHNGKKYGLLGLKICSNPYDSVSKK